MGGLYTVSTQDTDTVASLWSQDSVDAGGEMSGSGSIRRRIRGMVLRLRAEARQGRGEKAWLRPAVRLWRRVPKRHRRWIWSILGGR